MSLQLKSKNKHLAVGYRSARRSQMRRLFRRVIISIIIIISLLIGLGLTYTWYMGKYQKNPSVDQPAPTTSVVPKASAPTISDDARVGIAIQLLTSPIAPGSNSSISIKTNPKAACSIKIEYGEDKQLSTDSGLVPKTADEFGIVSWAWTVESSRPIGVWPVTVTCANKKHSAVGVGDLSVEKPN